MSNSAPKGRSLKFEPSSWNEEKARYIIVRALMFISPLVSFDGSQICQSIMDTIRQRRECLLNNDRSRYTATLSIDEYCIAKCLPYICVEDTPNLISEVFCLPEIDTHNIIHKYVPREFFATLCEIDGDISNIKNAIGFSESNTHEPQELQRKLLGYNSSDYYGHPEAYMYCLACQNSSGDRLAIMKDFSGFSEKELNELASRSVKLRNPRSVKAYRRFANAYRNEDTSAIITRLEANLIRRYLHKSETDLTTCNLPAANALSIILRIDAEKLMKIAKDPNWIFYNYQSDSQEDGIDHVFPRYSGEPPESHFALAERIADTFTPSECADKAYFHKINSDSWYVFLRIYDDKLKFLADS